MRTGSDMSGIGAKSTPMDIEDSSDESDEETFQELESSAYHKGHLCLAQGDVGTAYAYFLLLFKLNPARNEAIIPFTSALLSWSQKLCSIGRVTDGLQCCTGALAVKRNSAHLWYAYGTCLMANGMRLEALDAFRTAVRLRPAGLACARWAADTVMHELLERWHYPMLNDIERNTRYAVGISRAVATIGSAATVLEIGSGTGLLSMLAIRAGTKHVHAAEMSPLMCRIGKEAIAANGCADSITVHCRKSTDLCVPEHVPARASLVVTEIMDAALLGEHIVPALRHAWQNLILPPQPRSSPRSPDVVGDGGSGNMSASNAEEACGGRVIPQSASLHAVLTECASVRLHSRLVRNQVMGVDVSRVSVVGSDHVEGATPDSNLTGARSSLLAGRDSVRSSEPYSTEHFSCVRGGVAALQRPENYAPVSKQLLQVNFNHPQVPIHLTHSLMRLSVDKCGVLDTVAVYFEAVISDGNSISTCPFDGSSSDRSAWQQASFPVTRDKVLSAECWERRQTDLCELCRSLEHSTNSMRVCAGDVVTLKVECVDNDTCVAINVADIKRHCHTADQGSGNSIPSDQASVRPSSTPLAGSRSEAPLVFLDRAHVARLNDTEYWRSLQSAVASLSPSMPAVLRVLDLSHGLPLSGISLISQGQGSAADSRLILPEAEADIRTAVKQLTDHHGIEHQIEFMSVQTACSAGFDIIIADLIAPLGFLYTDALQQYALSRQYLRPGGTALPSRLELWAMCIDSAALRAQTSVLGRRPTLGLDVARSMNAYQVRTFIGLDAATLEFVQLTDPVCLLDVDLDFHPKYPFKEQAGEATVVTTAGGGVTAVVYWFKSYMAESVVVENHPLICQSVESHWRQSAIMLAEDRPVAAGQHVRLATSLQDGCVDITVHDT
eukprot:scpid35446/ scgid10919/ Putative protein arginine N-methyltransferase 10